MHQTSSNRLKTLSNHHPSTEIQKKDKTNSKLHRFFEESINVFRKQPKYFTSTIFKKSSNLTKKMNSESSPNLNDKFHRKNLTLEIIKKNFDELSTEKNLKNDIDQTDSTKFFRSETESSPKLHKKNGFSSITLLNDESVKNLNTMGSPKGSLNFRLRSYTAEYRDDYYLIEQSKINKKQGYDQYNQQFKENNLKKDGGLIFEGQIENLKLTDKEINEYEKKTKICFEKAKKKKGLKLFEKKVIL